MGMALAGVVLFAFTACIDLAGPGPGTGSGETIPPGMGLARIRLSAGGAAQSVRTLVPDSNLYYFTLKFSAPGKTDVTRDLSSGTTTLTVFLEPAVWKLEVKGYADSAHTNLRAAGNSSVPIIGGADASFNVCLTPGFSSVNTGNLYYSIGLPAIPIRAFLGLYPIDDTPGTSEEHDISASGGGTATGTLPQLPEGSYRAVIDLYDNSPANKAAVWTGVVHIHNGSTTSLIRAFTTADFAECPPVVGETETTLEAKLDAALGSSTGSYTIVLTGAETDLANFAPKNLTITGKNISITIRGNGETVHVASTVAPLFIVGAASGSSLSLTIQDLALQGLSGNSFPVVRVQEWGTLLMKANSRITGNDSSNTGGGVYITNDGAVIMSGGAVSGNSASPGGGGVFAYGNNAAFTMTGGAVSDNTSTSSTSYGGGVQVSGSGATFTMNGGAVDGNSAAYGGGVAVSGATFTMSGGAVNGNNASSSTSTSQGGGVSVANSGIFTMNSGAITGNTVTTTASAFAAYGGGVAVDGSSGAATFTMAGGAISGNNATTTVASTSAQGGGVFVSDGTFTMSGDAVVRGNTTSSSSDDSSGGGVAVYGASGTAAFTMNGGAVIDNKASTTGTTPSQGGGVYVSTSSATATFTMNNGAVVSGNTADSTTTASQGGGVAVSGSGSVTFTMNDGAVVSGNTASTSSTSSSDSAAGGGVFVENNGIFAMNSGAVVSGNTADSTTTFSRGGGVYVNGGSVIATFTMSGGAVSGNTASSTATPIASSAGGGVYVYFNGTFTMNDGAVSGNTAVSAASGADMAGSGGGGVLVNGGGTFTMNGGAVSGNTAAATTTGTGLVLSIGGGVDADGGTFAMSGGTVSGNILSDATLSYAREVVNGGTFNISGDARPERVFLYTNTQFITISGPLSGGPVPIPIDLGITSTAPLTDWEGKQILQLDGSYSGNLAILKERFILGNSKMTTTSPYTEEPIEGYKIDDGGFFVTE
jgi:hypothetical protein